MTHPLASPAGGLLFGSVPHLQDSPEAVFARLNLRLIGVRVGCGRMKNQTTSEHILAELRRRMSRLTDLPLRFRQWRQAQDAQPPVARRAVAAPELNWVPRRQVSVLTPVGPRDSLFTTYVIPPIADPHGR